MIEVQPGAACWQGVRGLVLVTAGSTVFGGVLEWSVCLGLFYCFKLENRYYKYARYLKTKKMKKGKAKRSVMILWIASNLGFRILVSCWIEPFEGHCESWYPAPQWGTSGRHSSVTSVPIHKWHVWSGREREAWVTELTEGPDWPRAGHTADSPSACPVRAVCMDVLVALLYEFTCLKDEVVCRLRESSQCGTQRVLVVSGS